jgi:hypothetical protein
MILVTRGSVDQPVADTAAVTDVPAVWPGSPVPAATTRPVGSPASDLDVTASAAGASVLTPVGEEPPDNEFVFNR